VSGAPKQSPCRMKLGTAPHEYVTFGRRAQLQGSTREGSESARKSPAWLVPISWPRQVSPITIKLMLPDLLLELVQRRLLRLEQRERRFVLGEFAAVALRTRTRLRRPKQASP
jgi:hypothetical protein